MDSRSPNLQQGQSKSPLQMLLKASTTSPFADCVLVSKSGERFQTYTGLLFKQSYVFKNMFESSGKPASAAAAEHGALELQLPDASPLIEAATAYINDSDAFWSAAKNSSPEELLRVVESLMTFAGKYNFEGICQSADDFLSQEGAIIKIINSGFLFKVWELVCRFSLGQSQGVLEAHISQNPTTFVDQMSAGIPPFCAHVRSTLTVGHSYATALHTLEGHADKLSVQCTQLTTSLQHLDEQATVLGRETLDTCKGLAGRVKEVEAEQKENSKYSVRRAIMLAVLCLFLGSCVGICSQQAREHMGGCVWAHVMWCSLVFTVVINAWCSLVEPWLFGEQATEQ